ncbi:hypothetical protein FOZ61_009307 [Perkinsus olseni]|uniref:Uncharacterized protein n=1 Tax=Perkinsus olseni TaxID=32597 RepID=A0A7J6M6C2_PEROL|nr:hypothetical protein FOZ61_009307 [Perkinsus olseni]
MSGKLLSPPAFLSGAVTSSPRHLVLSFNISGSIPINLTKVTHHETRGAHLHAPHLDMLSGGLGIAATAALLNPVEVLKVRMQTQQPRVSLTTIVKSTVKDDGLFGIWRTGVRYVIAAEFVNGCLRIGLYPSIKKFYSDTSSLDSASFPVILAASLTSGLIGSCSTTPLDRLKIRSQYEGGLKGPDGRYVTGRCVGAKPSFDSVVDGLSKNYAAGVLFKGVVASCARASLVTGAQITTYETTKRTLKGYGVEEGPLLSAIGGMTAGLVASTVAAPVDVVRTRLMSTGEYNTGLEGAIRILRQEGLRGLWRGWTAAYMRLGPFLLISWPTIESIRRHVFGLRSF